MKPSVAFAALSLVMALGCRHHRVIDDGGVTPPDIGVDAGRDASTDASADAPDTTLDANEDATDAAEDAALDALDDTALDDTATDSGDDAGVEVCDPGPWTWWQDMDGDGYGDPDIELSACTRPDGYVENDRDCDDSDPAISPDASEDPSTERDDDCDGFAASTPPVSVVGVGSSCTLSTHEVETDADPKLRVIAIYEPSAGPVQVRIESDQPMWLALQAYEATTWNVSERVPGTVLGIVVFGYETQTVNPPSGAVSLRIVDDYHSSSTRWEEGGARELVAAAERESGASFSSYAACYSGCHSPSQTTRSMTRRQTFPIV